MSEGLEDVKFALLRQEVDMLEWCVIMCPFPSRIGLPCMFCDLPNSFTLYQSDEEFKDIGIKICDLEEKSTLIDRTICAPSCRKFQMIGTDFYGQEIIEGNRENTIPFLQLSKLELNYKGKFAGSIVEPTVCAPLKGLLQKLEIYDRNGTLAYTIEGKLDQLGLCPCLPLPSSQKTIKFSIKNEKKLEVGSIKHLFFGYYNEFCSKSDQYGIVFPIEASEEHKALIVMAATFLDYLNFENF